LLDFGLRSLSHTGRWHDLVQTPSGAKVVGLGRIGREGFPSEHTLGHTFVVVFGRKYAVWMLLDETTA
ncbi:hypothetical protein, partial [Solidesulfovibrio alcoholivorans]|uniref:hypothetical protein n=1 Tax=Solidesulfovibrio alcoholivorans TaxID=81406 RepID=UPI001B8046BC